MSSIDPPWKQSARVGSLTGVVNGRALPDQASLVPTLSGPSGSSEVQVYTLPKWNGLRDERKVRWLRQNIIEPFAQDPQLRWFVVREIFRPASVAPNDYPAQVEALFSWVHANIYYVLEKGEQIQQPWRTIQSGTGDCDDMSTLLAAMAASVGLPARMVLFGQKGRKWHRWTEGNGRAPRSVTFSHIATEIGFPPQNPKHWATVDPILGGSYPGYDVTKHGVNVDRLGRPSAPAPREGQMQNYGYQPVGYGAAPNEANAEQDGVIATLTSSPFWASLAIEVVGAVASAVVIYYVIRKLDERT